MSEELKIEYDPFNGLIEGRIVHYVMPNGEHRPAIITKVWDTQHINGCSNLTVFSDWSNDAGWNQTTRKALEEAGIDPAKVADGKFWATSRTYSEKLEPGTWHWIER